MRVILISGDQILFLGLIFQGKVIKIYIHYGKFKLFFGEGGGGGCRSAPVKIYDLFLKNYLHMTRPLKIFASQVSPCVLKTFYFGFGFFFLL